MTKFGIFIPAAPDMHVSALDAFARGLDACGAQYRVYRLEDGYRSCDVAVTFGVAKEMTERGQAVGRVLRAHAERRGTGKHLVVERGFVQREQYYMVGWGGLNGRADYRNVNCPPDRWEKLAVEVQPWRGVGRHILLCGQVPWDASVQHTDHVRWCRETAQFILSASNRHVRFRPHPMQPTAIDMNGIDIQWSSAPSLQEDMQEAWAVVTFNSNAGVEATLAGIPAFAADPGAMGFPILNKDLRLLDAPLMPDRTQWLHNLAYTQWTLEEIAAGKPQSHLWHSQRTWLERLTSKLRRRYPPPARHAA